MKGKRRILLTSPTALNNGGVQYVLMTIVRNFSHLFVFDILTFNSIHNYYNKEFESFGGTIYCFNPTNKTGKFLKLLVALKLNKYLSNLFKNNDYYAVHCNSQFFDSIILKTAKDFNIGIRISHSHRFYRNESFLKEIYKNNCRKKIRKYATKFVGCSNLACESFFGVRDGYYVLNNPYDSNSIHFTSKIPKGLCLLQIGLFCDIKNQLFTLDVLSCIKNSYPNVILRLVGNGDVFFLEDKIKNLHLESNVIFHKQDEEKTFLFENSNYLIMPSKNEGFGIVLIEAQASGMYCFASDTITTATNLGGVKFLPLCDGPQKWADNIVAFYLENKGSKSFFDCNNFSIDHFNNDIRVIYKI